MDRLLSMTVFTKAVELGSFSAAGNALGMSSQLVGKHVQMLEQHLGVRLLNRTTRRQHLTDIGREFYERTKSILADVEAAEGLAAETRATPRGRLRINAPVTFGIHALSPKLPDYLNANAEVTLELSMTNRLVDVVDEGYDLVFRIGELTDSGLIARQLVPYRLILCAAPGYLAVRGPINTPQDLSRQECLGYLHPELSKRWTFIGPEGTITVPVSGRLMVDSGEALIAAALSGFGVLLQPFEIVEPYLSSGQLVTLLPEYHAPTLPMHILYAPDRRMTPKLRSFIDFAIAHFGPHV
ncbi:LysR family transcriptional regulator [Aeromonas veronii]|uniref:LysR family transcriptional regulator n=1 Tax=Aeromonas veronii TaxID=654 RepID=UPI0015E6F8D0|nr:LysR family transcriptional regulator [Aeromonas veronii]EKP0249902.1 LysR family transcriptional regulator [Aeromonas veronii]MBA2076786.1 LysR family transcriptional regulator [Aeromonas veronii]